MGSLAASLHHFCHIVGLAASMRHLLSTSLHAAHAGCLYPATTGVTRTSFAMPSTASVLPLCARCPSHLCVVAAHEPPLRSRCDFCACSTAPPSSTRAAPMAPLEHTQPILGRPRHHDVADELPHRHRHHRCRCRAHYTNAQDYVALLQIWVLGAPPLGGSLLDTRNYAVTFQGHYQGKSWTLHLRINGVAPSTAAPNPWSIYSAERGTPHHHCPCGRPGFGRHAQAAMRPVLEGKGAWCGGRVSARAVQVRGMGGFSTPRTTHHEL